MSGNEDRLRRIMRNLDADELESIIWRLVKTTGIEPALERAEEIAWGHTRLSPEYAEDFTRRIVDLEPYDMRRFPSPYGFESYADDTSVGSVYLACSIREEFEDDIAQMVNMGMKEEACRCLEAISKAMGEVDSYFTQDQCNTIEWYDSLIWDCVENGHPERLFDMAEESLNREVLGAWGSGWR